MSSSYFDDVVVEVSHDGALFTNVDLDDIIGGKASQSKFTNAELDDIIGKASHSKNEALSGICFTWLLCLGKAERGKTFVSGSCQGHH